MIKSLCRSLGDIDIIHGDFLDLPDTVAFLSSLVELDHGQNSEKRIFREHMAAAGIFNWEVYHSAYNFNPGNYS